MSKQQQHFGLPDDEVEMIFNTLIAPKPKKSVKMDESKHVRQETSKTLIQENQVAPFTLQEEVKMPSQSRLEKKKAKF